METVRVTQRVGKDGVLHLDLPVGFADCNVEVVVTYRPARSTTAKPSLADYYGVCKEDPLLVDDGGISDELEDEAASALEI